MICRRSLAIAALFFFSPSRNESNEAMALLFRSGEETLEEALLRRLREAQRSLLSEKPVDDVPVGLGYVRALHVDGWGPLVRRQQHGLRLRDHADERDAQDVLDVLDREHLAQ